MVEGLNLNLSFRSAHHLHDACEKPHLFDQRRHIPSERRVQGYCARPVIRAKRCGKDHQGAPRSRNEKAGHRVRAFPSWRETKVSYGFVERERSIRLFCMLYAQI
jgi:hypothetical protein